MCPASPIPTLQVGDRAILLSTGTGTVRVPGERRGPASNEPRVLYWQLEPCCVVRRLEGQAYRQVEDGAGLVLVDVVVFDVNLVAEDDSRELRTESVTYYAEDGSTDDEALLFPSLAAAATWLTDMADLDHLLAYPFSRPLAVVDGTPSLSVVPDDGEPPRESSCPPRPTLA